MITGIPKCKQEDTRAIVNNFCRYKHGVELMQRDLARTHRLGSRKEDVNRKMINRPIIVKFATYEVRDLVFRSKRNSRTLVMLYLKVSQHVVLNCIMKSNP